MTSPAVITSDLCFRYSDTTPEVLSGVDLSIAPREFFVLLGRSGTGKSTLLRTINGFCTPNRGEVRVHDRLVENKAKRLRTLRRQIGVIYQSHNLVGRLTASQNVITGMLAEIPLPRAMFGLFAEAEYAEASRLLGEVGLGGFEDIRVDQLSGGQKQRVAIARALAQNPSLILADEPVASLDPMTARGILGLLDTIRREKGITMIVSLHQLDLAREFGSRVVALSEGRVVVDRPACALTDAEIESIYPGKGTTVVDASPLKETA